MRWILVLSCAFVALAASPASAEVGKDCVENSVPCGVGEKCVVHTGSSFGSAGKCQLVDAAAALLARLDKLEKRLDDMARKVDDIDYRVATHGVRCQK
jgi:hypothetical protein